MRPPPNVVNAAVKEGHSNFVLSDDAIPQQCLVDNGRERNTFLNSNSPTPPSSRRYERCERNRGLLRQLSHRFGFRSNDDLNDSAANDDDNQSSSTESCSSSQAAAATTTTTGTKGRERPQQQQCMDSMLVSGTSSETSSTIEDIEEAVSMTQQQQQQKGQYENYENDSQVGEEGEEEEQDENAKQQQQAHHQHNNNGRRFNSRASFSRLQRRSTSTIRRALESFSLTTRSLSCSGATPPQQSDSACNTPKSSNNSTPIKSSLKCSSNLELHKKTSHTTLIAVNHQQQQHHYSFSAASSAHGPNHTHINCNVIKTAKQTKTKQPPQRILRQPVSYTYLKGISGLPTQRVPRNSVCCQYARH